MVPVAGLTDQRFGLGAAAAEDDGADRYAFTGEEFRRDGRTVLRRSGKS